MFCVYNLIPMSLCPAEHPLGLLGNANGDAEDDLRSAGNFILPSNATAREIFEQFGETCKSRKF